MSPTAILLSVYYPRCTVTSPGVSSGGGGVYPGWWRTVGAGRGVLPGTHPAPVQDSYLVIFWPQSPTYGQIKVNYEVSMRFLRYGSRNDQN